MRRSWRSWSCFLLMLLACRPRFPGHWLPSARTPPDTEHTIHPDPFTGLGNHLSGSFPATLRVLGPHPRALTASVCNSSDPALVALRWTPRSSRQFLRFHGDSSSLLSGAHRRPTRARARRRRPPEARSASSRSLRSSSSRASSSLLATAYSSRIRRICRGVYYFINIRVVLGWVAREAVTSSAVPAGDLEPLLVERLIVVMRAVGDDGL